MRSLRHLLLLPLVPLLTAAVWMDQQPSYKPYDPPRLTPPAEAVPITGREATDPKAQPDNPTKAEPASLARGAELFGINCSFCHGATSTAPGPVGAKLQPPAPTLPPQRLQQLADGELFQRISYGVGRMPPFQPLMTPSERWDLVNYLRSRQ